MAKSQQIDDAAIYRVTLNRKVEHDGVWLLPRNQIKVSGKVLKELGDAVDVAEPTQ